MSRHRETGPARPPTLPPLRPGRAAPPDLVARREGIDATVRAVHAPEGWVIEPVEVGGVAATVCTPPGHRGALLHFHGGGYRLGSPGPWVALGNELAGRTSMQVVLPDYRLAPEHPFPAALHDAHAVYAALVGRSDEPVFVAGDSAGGGLAVALAVLARDVGMRAPAGLILLSPWVDLTVTAASYRRNAARDELFSFESAAEAAAAYLQELDPREPLASPLYADLAGLPPTAVFAGSHEVLVDDACSLVRALAAADVATELHVVPDVPHVWPFFIPDHDASRHALDDIGRFVRRAERRG